MLNNVLQGRMKELKESEEEVSNMCALMEELQEKSRQRGEEKGRLEGIINQISTFKILNTSKDKALEILINLYSLTQEQAEEYIEKYWED